MKIAINCRSFLKKKYTGIGRYTYNLVKELGIVDQANQYCLYAQRSLFDFKRTIPKFNYANFSLKIDHFNQGLSRLVSNVDVYHAPSPQEIGCVETAKVIVTIHDMIFKAYSKSHTQQTIDILEKQMDDIAKRADGFICISKSSQDDLMKYYNVDPKKIHLVYNGVNNDDFYPVSSSENDLASRVLIENGIDSPFILFVGTIEPRKNLNNLLKAFKMLKEKKQFDGKVVVVGMKGWLVEDLDRLLDELKIRKDVIFLGYLPISHLRYLYNKAEVFAYPSFYEGFGFPILEAFSCGAPVITSNVSSCAEVAKNAAITVDPQSVDELCSALYNVIKSPELRNELKTKGLERAKDFSFRKTAQETLAVYNKVYNA